MDNSKKNVHSSGPLGMLVKTGQIKKIDSNEESDHGGLNHVGLDRLKATTSTAPYFRTQSGIEFRENELVLMNPKECEPWEYANRSEDEMGDMDELIRSIQENTQLQPALVRSHPNPHDGIKYQIIFGRRRHAACLSLGIPFLVIKKDSLTKQEAIACQDAENKFRKNVSNYSNAMLYKKLLNDGTFKTEKELAEKLGVASSSLNELMSYVKIPQEILQAIPDIHTLSVNMALKIIQLLNSHRGINKTLLAIAPEIGKSITSPAKLERTLLSLSKKDSNHQEETSSPTTSVILSSSGQKMFTFKADQKGMPCIVFHKDISKLIDFNKVCDQIKHYLEEEIKGQNSKFGYPNLVTK